MLGHGEEMEAEEESAVMRQPIVRLRALARRWTTGVAWPMPVGSLFVLVAV